MNLSNSTIMPSSNFAIDAISTQAYISTENQDIARVNRRLDEVQRVLSDMKQKELEEKEKESMNMFNFDFGSCDNCAIRMSMYGLAVKNGNDNWVSYDSEHHEIVNVDAFSFDGRKFMYKVPVACNSVKPGDVIVHNRVPMFVEDVEEGGTMLVIDPRAGECKEILPTKSPFGFNFMTKIVSLLDFGGGVQKEASAENPFGTNPLFMAMMMSKEEGGMDQALLPLILMNGKNMDMNAMLSMLALASDKKDKDNLFLPMWMAAQMAKNK